MNTVTVNASGKYDVLIGTNILQQIGFLVSRIRANCRAAIISDTNVWTIYGAIVTDSLEAASIPTYHYAFPAGEASKNGQTYLEILNFLAENKISRTDIVIALGGGVVGDIAGFTAATYLRGISYVQIPTSLLAMVDSSVGGKTAIDLPAGKNLTGAFKQPALVLCDVGTLGTLPADQFLDGCAEVIKYGMLYDADLIDYLLKTGPAFDRESVITKCVSYKRDVVQEDEFDTGIRQKLNLGHTIGHGIEAKSNYKISHGRAVAAGMAVVTKAAVRNGMCRDAVYHKLISLLKLFSLPIATDYTAEELYLSALSDKKRAGGSVNLIIPRAIGNCEIVPISVTELESFIKAGL